MGIFSAGICNLKSILELRVGCTTVGHVFILTTPGGHCKENPHPQFSEKLNLTLGETVWKSEAGGKSGVLSSKGISLENREFAGFAYHHSSPVEFLFTESLAGGSWASLGVKLHPHVGWRSLHLEMEKLLVGWYALLGAEKPLWP